MHIRNRMITTDDTARRTSEVRVLLTAGDLNALFDDHKLDHGTENLTFRNFPVTEQDVIV
jgi:hypothetical protein